MPLITMYVLSCNCCWRPAVMPDDAAITAAEAVEIAASLGWKISRVGDDRCSACAEHGAATPCHEQPVERIAS